jgi:hypothetical protein
VRSVFADLAAGRGIDPDPLRVAAVELGSPGSAMPLHEIAPVDVSIDHVTLGYSIMPATEDGRAVVDIVPTYGFSGHTSSGDAVSRKLVAVDASVAPAVIPPGSPSTGATVSPPPVGKPVPVPVPETVAGPPLT